MYQRTLTKPDGRALILYADAPIPDGIEAPSPESGRVAANPHLRWHPLRGEWVAYAGHRDARTFLPPPEYDPLAPTVRGAPPTELPAGGWDVAVFENRFPTLTGGAHDAPSAIVDARPAQGVCEVVVYGPEATGGLGTLPLGRIALLIDVWADRTAALGARDDVKLVMPFENRGVEVGTTLHHPHGQIYAYPFVPPILARELSQQRAYLAEHGRGLVEDHLAAELADGRRVLSSGDEVVALVPACARWAYEVWVVPRRRTPSLDALTAAQRTDLARALKTVVLKYDGLWGRPFPYVMVVHQAPSDGEPHREAHVHVELYPAYRSRDRLKYLAGSEIGAGMFTNDSLPEAKAAELRAVEVSVG